MKIYEKTSFYFQRYFLIFLILVAIEYSGQYSIKHLTRNIHDDKNTGQSNNFLQKSKKKIKKKRNELFEQPRNNSSQFRRRNSALAEFTCTRIIVLSHSPTSLSLHSPPEFSFSRDFLVWKLWLIVPVCPAMPRTNASLFRSFPNVSRRIV